MKKPTITDDLTKSEKKGAIEAAAAGGMKPGELFAAVVLATLCRSRTLRG